MSDPFKTDVSKNNTYNYLNIDDYWFLMSGQLTKSKSIGTSNAL